MAHYDTERGIEVSRADRIDVRMARRKHLLDGQGPQGRLGRRPLADRAGRRVRLALGGDRDDIGEDIGMITILINGRRVTVSDGTDPIAYEDGTI